jgi:hypothetical protein
MKSEMLETSVLAANDGIAVVSISSDLLLQRPNHPEHESQGREQ